MNNTLANIGSSPQLQGLATIGGVIALIIYGFAIARWTWSKRFWLRANWRDCQRAKIARKIKELRNADRMYRRGASDLLVIWTKLWRIFSSIAEMIMSSVVCLVNIVFYSKFSNEINFITAIVAFIFVAIKSFQIANLGLVIMERMVVSIDRRIALQRLRNEVFRTRRPRK